MDNFRKPLPEDLSRRLSGFRWKEVYAPYSGAATFYVEGEGLQAYLKLLPAGQSETLEKYKDRLLWLKGKLAVPELLYYAEAHGTEYLLMSAVEGKDAADESFKGQPEETIRLLAQGLKRFHAVAIDDCPFDYSLQTSLSLIERKLEQGTINKAPIESMFNESVESLYQFVVQKSNEGEEAPVLTHGDYCVPNIILSDGRVSGYIDLAEVGVSGRYRDLAPMHYSIIRNFGAEWLEPFYIAYGEKAVDEERLKLYDVLEQLLYH
jgi:aminoglycoside phosphotransferase